MAKAADIVILRDNQLIRGDVLIKEYKIETSFGVLKIAKSKIVHIHFKRASGTGFPDRDIIQTKDDGDYKGKILNIKTIPVKLSVNGQRVNIERRFVNTMVFPFSGGKRPGNIPDYSRK